MNKFRVFLIAFVSFANAADQPAPAPSIVSPVIKVLTPEEEAKLRPPPPARAQMPDLLAWDSLLKEYTTKPGELSIPFKFAVTNISDKPVVIDDVKTSCGCTVAKLPSNPWILAPKEGGTIDVVVDVRGKFGTLFKQVTVLSTNAPKTLTVKVNISQEAGISAEELNRLRNQEMAKADRQAVFKNNCAKCHLEPLFGKNGHELYKAGCAICHDSEHRATMVPDLRNLKKETSPEYWKAWITHGKVGTLMPAFGQNDGGPLTKEQIDSLVTYLDTSFRPSAAQTNAAAN